MFVNGFDFQLATNYTKNTFRFKTFFSAFLARINVMWQQQLWQRQDF